MTCALLCSSVTLGSAGRSRNGLAASLRFSLIRSRLILSAWTPYGGGPSPPAVAPHPDVNLVDPPAVAPVPLRVGGGHGAPKTLIILEAVWNPGVTVASDETRKEARS